ACRQNDAPAVDDGDVGEYSLDLVHFIGGDDRRPFSMEVLFEKQIIQLLLRPYIQPKPRILENETRRLSCERDREVQLGRTPLRKFADATPSHGPRHRKERL